MTNREQELRAMKGPELIKEADKLGVKVKCNKDRNKLVEAKAALVDRILAFEAEQIEVIPPNTLIETAAPENVVVNIVDDQQEAELDVEEVTPPTPKRGALIEWNGKAQNICAWAEELGISANTLYGRLYKLGWSVDKAFTRKGRK
jgi:hypothetical protein